MKPLLALAFIIAVPFSPLAAQAPPTVIGSWIGDAPGVRASQGLKVELNIANDGGTWSLSGILYQNGKEVGTFKGTDLKPVADGGILYFSEMLDKAPPEWSAKATTIMVQATRNDLEYHRQVGKKKSHAILRPKTRENFDRIVLGKAEPPPKKEEPPAPKTVTGDPIPSTDPNKLAYAVGPLVNLLFTADGKTLVTGAGDNVIRIWDFEARKQKAAIVTEKGLGCLAITPDGAIIAAGVGNTPVVWDAAGKEVARFPEHQYALASVAMTPDGKTLISSDDGTTIGGQPDGNTRIWDVESQKALANIPYCAKGTISLIPDANRIVFLNGRYINNAANPLQSFVHFYKAYSTKGKALYDVPTNHHLVRHTAISPDQKLVLAGDLKGNISLLNVATGKAYGTTKNKAFDYITTVAFTPDGKEFAVGGAGGQVVFYDRATGKEQRTLKVMPSELRRMAFSPDGRFLLAAGQENMVVVTPLKE
jgi:WD40 repeat protein